jgi:hypothetical protein
MADRSVESGEPPHCLETLSAAIAIRRLPKLKPSTVPRPSSVAT